MDVLLLWIPRPPQNHNNLHCVATRAAPPFGVNGAEVEWLQEEEEEGQQRRVSLSLWWQLNHGQGVNHHHLWLHISCK